MLTCPSVHPAYPKIYFRIMKTVNPLSQQCINRKFRKYTYANICHCHRASFMRSLFFAFKNDKWCHFVVRIGSPVLILVYCGYAFSFYFSLFSYFFVQSTACWGIGVSLTILIKKQWGYSYIPKWMRSGLLQPWLGSFWEKIEFHLISACLLELISAEYLHEINIAYFISQ